MSEQFHTIEKEFMWEVINLDKDIIINENLDSIPLFHYTTPEGFMGIIKNSNVTMWFSRFDVLNDISEGQEINRIFNLVCNRLIQSHNICDDFKELVLSIKIPNYRLFSIPRPQKDEVSIKKLECTPYICSFSQDDDSLAMWNSYVKDKKYNGYCLEFSSDIFKKQIDYKFGNTNLPCGNIEIYRIIYNTEEKFNILWQKVEKCYNFYTGGISTPKIKSFLQNTLETFSLSFKNDAFKHENEIRVVMYVPKLEGTDIHTTEYVINYRNRDSLIIPYIEVSSDERKYLRKVRLCPFN